MIMADPATRPSIRREYFDPPGLSLMRCTAVTSSVRMCFAQDVLKARRAMARSRARRAAARLLQRATRRGGSLLTSKLLDAVVDAGPLGTTPGALSPRGARSTTGTTRGLKRDKG